jgi:hypothetical protein
MILWFGVATADSHQMGLFVQFGYPIYPVGKSSIYSISTLATVIFQKFKNYMPDQR